MSRTINDERAFAAYRAELNRREEARRLARLDAIRNRLVRRFLTERGSWLFAAMSIGAAVGLLVERFVR